jgi:hypothetical protein
MSRTLKQLIECYQTDPDSNFLKLQYQVRVKHGRLLARLSDEHRSHQLRNVRFRDLLAWYNAILVDGKIATARSIVDRLRELFRFGATLLEDRECGRLFEVLGKLRLEDLPPRTIEMTAEHAIAIRKAAHERGWLYIALAQALQFDLLMGQKDVIGEWIPETEPGESDVKRRERRLLRRKDVFGGWKPVNEPGNPGIWVERTTKWVRGLRWSDIDKNLILRHTVGSSGRAIEVDLRTAPMVLEELMILAESSRRFANRPDETLAELFERIRTIVNGGSLSEADTARDIPALTPEDLTSDGLLPNSGPMILCEINAWPYSTAEFRRKWRKVAKQAGVPDNVHNRDSFPAGMIRGGPERAKISQAVTLKRIDYSLRMQRRAGRFFD